MAARRRLVQLAALTCAARALRTLGGLRERADRRGRKGRQVEARRADRRRAARTRWRGGAIASSMPAIGRLDRRIVDPRRSCGRATSSEAASGRRGRSRGAVVRAPCRAPSVRRASAPRNASQLLTSGSRSVSSVQIDRNVQQRARRRDLTPIPRDLSTTGSSQSSDAAQIALPDVAAVDDAERQHAIRSEAPWRRPSSWSGARTRSTCRPATGSASAVSAIVRPARRNRSPA